MHLGYANTIGRLYIKKEEELEEVINDGFMKVFTNLHKYDFSKPFKTWFRAILVNTCIDYYRKTNKQPSLASVEGVEFNDFEPDAVSNLSAEELLAMVQQLPPTYKMVFTLYVIEGYTHKEIGEMLGIQEGTSKSNLRDARIKLQKMITNAYGTNLKIIKSNN